VPPPACSCSPPFQPRRLVRRALHRRAVDSTAVGQVTVWVIKNVSGWLARAAVDSSSQAWDITFPKDGPTELWQRVRRSLLASLHGRPVRAGDKVRGRLDVKRVWIEGDSLFAYVTSGSAIHCPKSWMEDTRDVKIAWASFEGIAWKPPVEQTLVYSESFYRCPDGEQPTPAPW
jgi:hypothetical protein